MKILLTGASGFLGKALAWRLAADGHYLRLPIRQDLLGGHLPRDAETPIIPAIETMQSEAWLRLCEGMDAVIHAAAIAHIGASVAHSTYEAVNRDASGRLAAAAAQSGVTRFVFISSIRAQVGATSPDVQDETILPMPTEAYGRSKLQAEQVIRAALPQATILRPALIIGPQPKGNLKLLLKLADLPVRLPLAALHEPQAMVSLEAVLEAVALALVNPAMQGEIYCLAQEPHASLSDIMRWLRQGLGRSERLFPVPEALLTLPLRLIGKHEITQRLVGGLKVDAAKLRAQGWQAQPSLQEAIGAVAAAYRSGRR